MYESDNTLEILTLGRFSISVNGKPVATEWPDEAQKLFFCSLLSPLDMYFTWDRICRSMWDVPVTRTDRRRLEAVVIRPLSRFLLKELGFNPLITGSEGMRIDRLGIRVDAHEFYSTFLEGLRLSSLANNAVAREKYRRAKTLYVGSYLPGFTGKIISNTRRELESLYLSAAMDAVRQ